MNSDDPLRLALRELVPPLPEQRDVFDGIVRRVRRRRRLLLAEGLVAVLVLAGIGVAVVPQLSRSAPSKLQEAGPATSHSATPSAAAPADWRDPLPGKPAAQAAAMALLAQVRPPAGATLETYPSVLTTAPEMTADDNLIDVARTWTLPTPAAGALADPLALLPSGFTVDGGSSGSDGIRSVTADPRVDPVWDPEVLLSTVTLRPGISEFRADVQLIWQIARSKAELAEGSGPITLTYGRLWTEGLPTSLRITAPVVVARLTREFNALPVVTPGFSGQPPCGSDTISVWVQFAGGLYATTSTCSNDWQVTLDARPMPALVDDSAFSGDLAALLHVPLS